MQLRFAALVIGVGFVPFSIACSDDAGPNVNGGSAGVAGATAGAAAGGNSTGGGGASAGTANAAGGGVGGGGGTSGGGVGGATGGGGSGSGGCSLPPMGQEAPAMLSQTGCVNMADPSKPAPGLIPYSVRSPLWSDAAEKHRFVRIPDGGKIKVLDCATNQDGCNGDTVNGDDGHWEVPIGSVLVKNFSIEGKIIETRLIMRRSATKWLFYGYEWNAALTEATLLPDDNLGKDRPVGSGTQVWHYPGRGQCPQCHTPGGGFSLGPSTPQMNSDFPYADGMMNQVEKFKALGLFETAPKAMTGYPDPAGADSLEDRARSYLQTNCAICHRPSGEYSGMDMRWGKPIDAMKICDPSERDAELVKKYRVVPGKPEDSTMSFRMHAMGGDNIRMPKIGSNLVDPKGTELIDAWIEGLPANACPNQVFP
jgi:uncharacterized repeat protein (TIGR03806 family)